MLHKAKIRVMNLLVLCFVLPLLRQALIDIVDHYTSRNSDHLCGDRLECGATEFEGWLVAAPAATDGNRRVKTPDAFGRSSRSRVECWPRIPDQKCACMSLQYTNGLANFRATVSRAEDFLITTNRKTYIHI